VESVNNLLVGETAVVANINGGSHHYRKRLFAAGIVPGASITLSQKAPFGDLIKIAALGGCIALRAAEASIIKIIKTTKK
jgi:Fe2+ transport system protein FeoA